MPQTRCPHCGFETAVDEEHIGALAGCPECDGEFEVVALKSEKRKRVMKVPARSKPREPADDNRKLTREEEKLLKKATHAGRNLAVLAVLFTFGAVAMGMVMTTTKGSSEPALFIGLAASAGTAAVALWILASAAKKGSVGAITIVYGLYGTYMALNLCSVFLLFSRDPEKAGEAVGATVGKMLIPLLVLIALNDSRKVLIGIRDKGLTSRVFTGVPNATAVVLAGVMLGVATFTPFALGIKSGVDQAKTAERNQSFVGEVNAITQKEEAVFLASLGEYMSAPGPDLYRRVNGELLALRTRVEGMRDQCTADGHGVRFAPALGKYLEAIDQWKRGVQLVSSDSVQQIRQQVPGKGLVVVAAFRHLEEAQKHFELGDELKQAAFEAFNKALR